jgi:tRNA threonylcarbamoyladenosine biosynthesis protein TsaE
MKEYVSKNEADTVAYGERIGVGLLGGEVIILCGTLGSGKTVLTKGIARGMGIAEVITSPSFTIMNEYKGQLTLCHFDFYRIERVAEMEDLVEDYLYRTDTVVVVEWGMKLGQLINEYIQITIDIRDEYRRIVTKEHSP